VNEPEDPPVVRAPITAPAPIPQKSSAKSRKNKDVWQNQPNRKATNAKVNSSSKRKSPEELAKIYKDHPKDAQGRNICWAKKNDGSHCTLPAGSRTEHEGWGKCSFHGGNTPTLSSQAGLYMGVEIAQMTVSYGYGGPILLHPHEALLQEVARAGGHVAWLADRIGLWDMTDEEGNLTKPINDVQQQWIDLYHKERAILVKVAKTALDAGIDERRVRMAESQGKQIMEILNKAFDALGLSVEQRKMIPMVVPGLLRSYVEPKPQFALEQGPDRHGA